MSFMRFFLLCNLLSLGFTSSADTLDFWHIRCNNDKAIVSTYSFTIHKSDIKPSDTLYFTYVNDSPCLDCEHELHIESRFGKRVDSVSTNIPNSPLKIPLRDVVLWSEKANTLIFDAYYKVFYFDGQTRMDLTYIFSIIITQ